MFNNNQEYAYVPWSMIFLATYLREYKYEPVIIDEFTKYPNTPLTDLAIKHGFRPPQSLKGWAKHPLFVDTTRSYEEHRTWLNPRFQKKYFEILNRIAVGRSKNTSLKPAGTRPKKFS